MWRIQMKITNLFYLIVSTAISTTKHIHRGWCLLNFFLDLLHCRGTTRSIPSITTTSSSSTSSSSTSSSPTYSTSSSSILSLRTPFDSLSFWLKSSSHLSYDVWKYVCESFTVHVMVA